MFAFHVAWDVIGCTKHSFPRERKEFWAFSSITFNPWVITPLVSHEMAIVRPTWNKSHLRNPTGFTACQASPIFTGIMNCTWHGGHHLGRWKPAADWQFWFPLSSSPFFRWGPLKRCCWRRILWFAQGLPTQSSCCAWMTLSANSCRVQAFMWLRCRSLAEHCLLVKLTHPTLIVLIYPMKLDITYYISLILLCSVVYLILNIQRSDIAKNIPVEIVRVWGKMILPLMHILLLFIKIYVWVLTPLRIFAYIKIQYNNNCVFALNNWSRRSVNSFEMVYGFSFFFFIYPSRLIWIIQLSL